MNGKAVDGGQGLRIIKKYPNRRLYDTTISSYITLEDVRRLVLQHSNFCVRDAKTDEDITRNILLQIIIEREEGGEPIFSTDVLQQIIRFYGDALQGMIATYIDRSLKLIVDQQHALRAQMHNVVSGDPLAMMRDITEKNLSLWKEMQERFLRGPVSAPRGNPAKKITSDGRTGKRRP